MRAIEDRRPARFPGVCVIPFEPTFVRLPGDAGRIDKLTNELRVLVLVNLALDGECIDLREQLATTAASLLSEREKVRALVGAQTAAQPRSTAVVAPTPQRPGPGLVGLWGLVALAWGDCWMLLGLPERARKSARAWRCPEWLAACLGALCLFVDAVWSQDMTRRAV